MASFNSSAGLQVQKYDLAGVPSAAALGQGTQLCICFAVDYTVTGVVTLDICLLVGKSGEARLRSARFGGDVAVGIQNPERDSSKALPQCKDVDLSQYSTITRGSASGSANPTPTVSAGWTVADTKHTTNAGAGPTQTATSENGPGRSGLSTEAKIALATGIPGGIVAAVTIIGWFWRKKTRQHPVYI